MANRSLQKLGPSHRAAVRLRIEGKRNEDIAHTLNISKRQLEIWFSDPLVKTEIGRQMEEIDRVFQERMAGAGLAALESLQEVAQLPVVTENGEVPPFVRMEAATQILDRIPTTARIRDRKPLVEGDTTNIQAIIAQMPDSELAALLQSWSAGTGRPSEAIEAHATTKK